MSSKTKKTAGFNLVEAAIVLGVVGLVIGGIWTVAASVDYNRKLNHSIQLVSVATNNAVMLFKNMPTFGTLEGEVLRSVTPPGTKLSVVGNAFFDDFGNTISLHLTLVSWEISISFNDESLCPGYAPRLYAALKASIIPSDDGYFIYGEDEDGDISTPAGAALYCADEIELTVQR